MKLFRALFVKNGNLLECADCIVRIRFPITAGTWSCIHFQNRSIYVFDLISFYFPPLSYTRSLVRLFRKITCTECTMHCCRKSFRFLTCYILLYTHQIAYPTCSSTISSTCFSSNSFKIFFSSACKLSGNLLRGIYYKYTRISSNPSNCLF